MTEDLQPAQFVKAELVAPAPDPPALDLDAAMEPDELAGEYIVEESHVWTDAQLTAARRQRQRELRAAAGPHCMRDNRLPDARLPCGLRVDTRQLGRMEISKLAELDERIDDAGDGDPVPLTDDELRDPLVDRLVWRGLVTIERRLVGITPAGDRVLQRRRG